MLISGGFLSNTKIGVEFDVNKDVQKLLHCFSIAEKLLDNFSTLKEVRYNFHFILFIFLK